ncbi:MAG: Na/Pi cotransporter family protein [Lysobacteraceae bacterium]
MSLASILQFAGGIGLFLLGMRLMSDGLKVAAGPALRSLLASATRSRGRGVASGVLITSLVQSSSAVIFATIGFVNAGLLNLGQAIGVVFGANLGTTLTSWIVALVGFNVDLQVLAMPAVAIGMGLWIAGGGRRAALGQALVGFGIFFLGLDVLKDSFQGLGDGFDLQQLAGDGLWTILLFALAGTVLTVLMQSSSATLAVTLTAAAGGTIPMTAAAAMVIGAKIGTTSTAAFAVFGATADARRAAAAHVAFNLVTALIALPLLLWLLQLAGWLAQAVGAQAQPATVLAVFHTLTALLGLAVLWPLTGRLVALLQRRFGGVQADPAQPRHLDRHVLGTPRLALDAADRELRRLAAIALGLARQALSREDGDGGLEREREVVERLGEAVMQFAGGVQGGDPVVEQALPNAVRVAQYYRGVGDRSVELARLPRPREIDPALAEALDELHALALQTLDVADPALCEPDPEAVDAARAAFEEAYQALKGRLLRAGGRGELGPGALVRLLDRESALRRIIDQSSKAARYLAGIEAARTPLPEAAEARAGTA